MINKASKVSLVILLIAIGFGVMYTQSNDSTESLPMLSRSLGNLESYELVLNCDLDQNVEPVTMAWIQKVPLKQEEAVILAEVFGLFDPDNVEKSEVTDILRIQKDNLELTFYDKNNILYREKGIKPVVKDYTDSEMISIANDFLLPIIAAWNIDTDVEISVEKVAPYWKSTTVYPDGSESTVTRGIGVRYRLYLDEIKLDGAGTEVTVVVAENRVISADLHLPSIKRGGKKELNIPLESALNTMITRETERSKQFGSESETASGTLVIDMIEPVYYWHHQDEIPDTLPIFYKIRGRVITDRNGQSHTDEFSVYEYTNP